MGSTTSPKRILKRRFAVLMFSLILETFEDSGGVPIFDASSASSRLLFFYLEFLLML
jgi:hypothetical protein